MGTLVLSFIIPALQFNLEKEIEVQQVIQPTPIATNVSNKINNETVDIQFVQANRPESNLLSGLPYVYCIIAFAILSFGLFHLYKIIRQAASVSLDNNGLKVIYKTGGFTNCSFFKYVFIDNENLTESEICVLLKHEAVHANQYHSIDKILMIICKAFLWFNPIIYLFDKELEQTHEYEADLLTSALCGSERYASLLLKLAISKSEMPLAHNFVKSPVKERIKMLFNSKSKEMKKLIYLLALPIVFCLVWVFAVQVVYAQTKQNTTVDIQPAAEIGEIIKGKVVKVEKISVGVFFELSANGKTYPIEANSFSNRIKIGDQVVVYISSTINKLVVADKKGRVIRKLDYPVYMLSKITDFDGKVIFESKSEKHAFGYEVNKARFATSKIKSIKKNSNGTLNKIVLNDGTFTINFDLNGQNMKQDKFKIGDEVVVKFIGEKTIAKNEYSSSKLIVMYAQSKKYELKNEALFNRFYQKDGRQKVAAIKLQSKSESSRVNNLKQEDLEIEGIRYSAEDSVRFSKDKSVILLFGQAKLTFKDLVLDADEITFNQKDNTGLAKNLVLTNKSGTKIKGSNAKFNLNGNVEIWQNVGENVIVEP
ncbi:M56 family metallopeptidase [Pedobacter aquatilis]|uniref:M56 family metallopeptidase n=1 Tax=Pedobacter aquatilis TaxID=351343 RepID=UPI0025B30300|nr:M56 family metallopeptidase [Pedobacter aquatilis]MDN3585474.1 M56 family metallopeptidase [Pedobacter aquatilis]